MYELLRLRKVLLIGHVKAQFVIWLTVEGGCLNVFDKDPIAAAEVLILRKLASLERGNDPIQHSLVSRKRIVAFVSCSGGSDERIDVCRYPWVRVGFQARAGRSLKIAREQEETKSDDA